MLTIVASQIPLFESPELWKPDPAKQEEQPSHPGLFSPASNRAIQERRDRELRELFDKAAQAHPHKSLGAVMDALGYFAQGDRRPCVVELFLKLYWQAFDKGLLPAWLKRLEERSANVPDRTKVVATR